MSTSGRSLPLLAAYAMAPKDPAARSCFYEQVSQLKIGGLELPVSAETSRTLDEAVAVAIQPHWDLVLTCIPTVVARLVDNPHYGLASEVDSGRRMALSDVARARDLAQELTGKQHRVLAIEVHSAPGPALGSTRALARSLETILSWDLSGASLLVEHCDAVVPGQIAAKGFLGLPDEILTLHRVLRGSSHVGGLSINWGRSAIEGRSAAVALDHVRIAAESGLLRTVFFSGATASDTPWGPAWSDQHIPPRPDRPGGPLELATSSLLGSAEIASAMGVLSPAVRSGLKISVRPHSADVGRRIDTVRAALTLLDPAESGQLDQAPAGFRRRVRRRAHRRCDSRLS